MAALELRDLDLQFGGLVVLNKVSLSVERGELLALVGPNGAGKTSVLNCITGLYRPNGSIRFHGNELIGLAPHEVVRQGVARTFQHGELFGRLTVRGNLLAARHALMKADILSQMFSLPSARREEKAHREAVDRVLEFMDLTQYGDAVTGSLPFGVQKLIGFARAIAAEPACLLLDEPSAGLTQDEREDLAHCIVDLKAKLEISMIWIEHDMQMVAAIADRVHVLDYGRSIADGRADEVLNDDKVIKAYLGTTQVA